MRTWRIMKDTFPIPMDSITGTYDDAIAYCEMVANEHANRIVLNTGDVVSAVIGKAGIAGYRFTTSNGSDVMYWVTGA